jgi:hypothetical protein
MAGPSLIATIFGNIRPLTQSLDEAKRYAQTTGTSIKSSIGKSTSEIGSSAAGAFGIPTSAAAGVAAAIGAATAIGAKTVEYASHVADLSARLGISTDAVQEWDYALKQNGSSIDAAVPFFEKLAVAKSKALAGDDKAIAGFAKFGIGVSQLKSQSLESVGVKMGKRFENENPTEVSADFRELGIKGAGDMAAAFAGGMQRFFDEAHELSLIIDPESVAKLDEIGDKWDQLKLRVMSIAAPIITSLMPIVEFVGKIAGALQLGVIGPLVASGAAISAFFKEGPGAAMDAFQKSMGETAKSSTSLMLSAVDGDSKPAEKRKTAVVIDEDANVKTKKETAAEKQAQKDADKRKREADALEKKERADEERERKKADRDALKTMKEEKTDKREISNSQPQLLAGYLGSHVISPEASAADVQRKSEVHLGKMINEVQAMRRIMDKLNGVSGKGVEF